MSGNAPELAFARALYIGTMNWAIGRGASPGILETRLRSAAAEAGHPFKETFSQADLAIALRTARGLFDDIADLDPDVVALRGQVDGVMTEVVRRPDAFQSMSVMLIGSGLILALAVLGKLKVKDGKWELKEGLPGFEKLAKLFPSIFSA